MLGQIFFSAYSAGAPETFETRSPTSLLVMKQTKFLRVTYDELDKMVESLYDNMEKAGFIPDIILAIARGGWFPARVLSDIYSSKGIPVDVVSITTKFYTSIGETAKRPVLLQELSQSLFDQSTLIVDDVSDTGRTLKFIRGYVSWLGAKDARVATVFMKPETLVVPDFYVKEVSQDTWIIFPYEIREMEFLLSKTGS